MGEVWKPNAIGQAWAAMAHAEGHRPLKPKSAPPKPPLTASHRRVLAILDHPLTSATVAALTGFSVHETGNLVAQLVARGFVVKQDGKYRRAE